MISPAYVRIMARYNAWQNHNIYAAAASLSDANRKVGPGAFFGSIHATLHHLMWADQMWLSRFGATEPPAAKTINDGLTMFERFEALLAARKKLDATIENWARGLSADWLTGDLVFYSASFGTTLTRPRAVLVVQLFNHQTHHRGQLHAMLTGFGVKLEPTDLPMNSELWDGVVL